MKRVFIGDLVPGDIIQEFFVVRSCDVRSKKDGGVYLALVLADRTGSMDAKIWSNLSESIPKTDRIIKIEGTVETYRDDPQLNVKRWRVANDEEIDITDFLPTTTHDRDEMWNALHMIILTMEPGPLLDVTKAAISRHEMMYAPAASNYHHAFIGGLLEHVLELARAVVLICTDDSPFSLSLDRDLLIAACVWHDIGKIKELSYTPTIGYTRLGSLVGHQAIALQMLEELCAISGYEEADTDPWRYQLEHIIVSHHGKRDNGSAVEPATAEAILFHHLDEASAHIAAIAAAVGLGVDEDGFTDRVAALGRRAYVGVPSKKVTDEPLTVKEQE